MFEWLFRRIGRICIIDIPPDNAVPPGFAHKHIRERFVGVEVKLVPKKELEANPPPLIIADAMKKIRGYVVRRSDCINALKAAGSPGAANFWSRIGIGHYLFFPREVCKRIWW